MYIQDLSISIEQIKSLLMRIPNTGISFLYRNLRRQGRFSAIGDYPMLAFSIRTASYLGKKYNRKEINYALNQISEFSDATKKEKMILLDQLLLISHGGLK